MTDLHGTASKANYMAPLINFAMTPHISSDTADREAWREAVGEKDPLGKDAHEPGAKLDHGKNRLGLIVFGFSRALGEVGRVGTYGANKYTDNGWMSVPNGIERYTDALLRHLLKEAQGEAVDQDTELLHAAHLAWNSLARLELMLREKEVKG